jgi:uncharacterized protein (DUF488 family)
MNNALYTIGYSSYSPEEFIEALKFYRINAVADVRTTPYSRFKPDFNLGSLVQLLKTNGIFYVSLGKELGARSVDDSCYENGRVKFSILEKSNLFLNGLERLRKGLKKYTIALMCAEQDPIQCHRYILVAYAFYRRYQNIAISNILEKMMLENKADTDKRLLKLYHMEKDEIPGLGQTYSERLHKAYTLQGEKISYQAPAEWEIHV